MVRDIGINILKMKEELVIGLVYGLIIGLIIGLVYGLFARLITGLIIGLVYGLVYGLFAGLVYGLFAGLGYGLVTQTIAYFVNPELVSIFNFTTQVILLIIVQSVGWHIIKEKEVVK